MWMFGAISSGGGGVGASTLYWRGVLASPDKTQNSFTWNSNWYDWSLTTIVPTGTKAVLIAMELLDNSAIVTANFRKKGDTSSVVKARSSNQVTHLWQFDQVWVECDAARTIQFMGSTKPTYANFSVIAWVT